MPGRLACLMALLVLAASAPSHAADGDKVVVTVSLSGALEKTGVYSHAADAGHTCRMPVEIPPPPGQPSNWGQLPFALYFAPQARPPEARFVLEQTADGFRITMTAGGRLWHGDSVGGHGQMAFSGPGPGSGHFHLDGLAPEDGGPERIGVQGIWRCRA